MPTYTFSQGQTGSQSSISINTGTPTSPTYTAVEEVMSIAQSGNQLKTVNSTNLQSTVEEIIPSLPNSGEFKVSCLRVPASVATGQQAVLTQFNLGSAQAPILFEIQLSKDAAAGQTSTGDKATFSGYVTDCSPFVDISPDKAVMFEFTVKVVTVFTYTSGS